MLSVKGSFGEEDRKSLYSRVLVADEAVHLIEKSILLAELAKAVDKMYSAFISMRRGQGVQSISVRLRHAELAQNNAACRYSCCSRVKEGRTKSGRPDSVHNVIRSEAISGLVQERGLQILQNCHGSSFDHRSCSRGDMGFSIVVSWKILPFSISLTWSTSIFNLIVEDKMNPWHAFS